MNDSVEASIYEMNTSYYTTKINAHDLKIGLKCSFRLDKSFVLFCFLRKFIASKKIKKVKIKDLHKNKVAKKPTQEA